MQLLAQCQAEIATQMTAAIVMVLSSDSSSLSEEAEGMEEDYAVGELEP